MDPNNDSQRRVILVTGAARGQGLAIVRKLVADHDVVACDVLAAELGESMAELPAEHVLIQQLEVSSPESWSSALSAVTARFGRLDGLVNNAGILYRASIEDDSPADFERAWRVNCLGPFLGIQACLPLLKMSSAAAIVNTVSSAGMRPFPNHIGYSTSKWGLRGLSLSAAVELGELGIRVNSVMPGPIATPMHDAETTKRLAASPLLGRPGQADEIAETVAFLLSPASSFTVGAEVLVDGGQLLRMHT